MTHTVSPEDWRWGPSLDAVVAAPSSHRVVFENAQVRVLEVTVQPGVREPEPHPPPLPSPLWPSVMVTDSRARIRYRVGDEVTFESPDPLPPRDALAGNWMGPEGPHSVENIDVVPLHALRFELKG